ncbi:methyl-accepting chemotaxis protein [Oleiagrimonas sp. C23AA]|uniref:methyl-accepting chemotaxis protein n=1 Tax=Oleiagrimonas sp. C23AA TaxID=2719047 RepID=UPI0014220AB2|nr:methyl-accepting chemotaxis protein [Oleiagrimonas sp. C23AA]NII11745.1 hypothetical protein [Oleiagrimonas sp. C23AA]
MDLKFIQRLRRPRPHEWVLAAGVLTAILAWLPGGWLTRGLTCLAALATTVLTLRLRSDPGATAGTESASEHLSFAGSAEALESEVTSLWVRNIETGRSQSEQALVDLSARFSGMVDRLERAVKVASMSSDEGDAGNVQALFESSQAELESILESLRQALHRSDVLFEQLDRLMKDVSQLREMSGLVNSMAQQTKLVSLNAAVEAARAGEAGRAFSVVADEVRTLATTSGETSKQISKKIDAISESMDAAFAAAQASSEHSAFDRAEQGIVKVMDDVRNVTGGLKNTTDLLRETSVDIRGEVAEALVLMQFQDRVSQILSHVRDNIQAFPRYLAEHEQAVAEGREAPADWSALRQALQGSYATVEEHRNHGGTDTPADNNNNDDDITFF